MACASARLGRARSGALDERRPSARSSSISYPTSCSWYSTAAPRTRNGPGIPGASRAAPVTVDGSRTLVVPRRRHVQVVAHHLSAQQVLLGDPPRPGDVHAGVPDVLRV